jgi:PAS domain S-box-containing protein
MLHEALDSFGPDIVLSDYSMPGFGGHDALDIVIRRSPETPFVYVSGTIGEERAIEALQRGAWDYVLKENLRRLPASIDRALRMAAERAERAAIQRALRESEERFRSIVETSQDWIWENDADFRLTYSNQAVGEILGYEPDELQGRLVADFMDQEDRAEVERRMPHLIRQRQGWRHWRLRWRRRDGAQRVLESTGRPVFDDDGRLLGFRGIDHDITERLQQEAHIRRLARIHAVLSAVGNMALRAAGRDELLLAACRIAVEQGGFSAAGIGVREGDHLRVVRTYGNAALIASVAPEEPMPLASGPYAEHPSLRAFNQARILAIPDYADPDISVPPGLRATMLERGVHSQISLPLGSPPWGLLALYSDVVRVYDDEEVDLLRRLADELDYAVDFLARGERLQYLAYHNPATGLPNRAAFQQRVRTLMGRGPVVMVAFDAQGFARISHSRGRDFGNALLASIGSYLKQERPEGCVAHPEADMFLLAWPSKETPEAEHQWLEERLARLARRAFVVEGEQIHVLLRAGMARGPDHGGDADTLERAAFAALSDARDQGVLLRAYSEELRDRAVRRMALERDLRQAIAEEQFSLHFQPKFDAHTGALAGAEALLRWQHPVEGWISPAEFIPLLEDSGLLVAVGRWVMREAIVRAQSWRQRDPSLRLAVNVSARELRHAGFLDACRELLAPFGGRAPIDVEITESVIVDDVENSVQLLQALRGFGCGIAIDDFGTGYSSLNYLVRLPVDTLKIDRSFVAMLEESPETVTLVANTIGLAHSLGLDVVAEGVETEAQAAHLRRLGCEVLQGYLLGRPLPPDAFEARFLPG